MSRDTVDGGLTLTGTIKWFDPVKGFGFIVSNEIDMDILLHANVLRNFGQSSIADGVEIKVIAHRSDRDIQASEVLSVASPRSFNTFGYGKMDALDDVALSEIELQPGRIKWFDKASTSMPLTEMDIEVKILEFREQIDLFQGLSFATIAGAGPNGAIVHYMASPETNRQLETGSLLLLDSGGQYLDGTTDITRTLAVGVPSDEMRKHFTLVLKGHIAIASARFPVGTNGGQLDALARQHLWRDGLNYQHGTGHGVGSFLGVHEGPHRLAAGSTVPFEAGMFISNEPGLYLPNQYGIRIESLFVVIDSTIDKFLEFAPLSVVPMDRKLIDVSLMNKQELAWLDDYYKKVFDYAAEHLDEDERQWLAATCAPLSA